MGCLDGSARLLFSPGQSERAHQLALALAHVSFVDRNGILLFKDPLSSSVKIIDCSSYLFEQLREERSLKTSGSSFGFSHALAWFNISMAEGSNSSLVASIKSVNCSRLVALAIGAVTVGRAMSHASATRAGVESYCADT